jgi:hypothetical protein
MADPEGMRVELNHVPGRGLLAADTPVVGNAESLSAASAAAANGASFSSARVSAADNLELEKAGQRNLDGRPCC